MAVLSVINVRGVVCAIKYDVSVAAVSLPASARADGFEVFTDP